MVGGSEVFKGSQARAKGSSDDDTGAARAFLLVGSI